MSISSSVFNLFEGFFWILLAFTIYYHLSYTPPQYRSLAKFTIAVLILFAISDWLQVYFGSFLAPGMEWLYWWKLINLFGLIGGVIWYLILRIAHSKSTASSTDTGQ